MQKGKKSQRLNKRKHCDRKPLGLASAAFFSEAWHLAHCPSVNTPHTRKATSPIAWSADHSLNPKRALFYTRDLRVSADCPKGPFRALGSQPHPKDGLFSRRPGQPAEGVSLSCVRAAAVCWKQAIHPMCISVSDSSNDYKLYLEVRAKEWGEYRIFQNVWDFLINSGL